MGYAGHVGRLLEEADAAVGDEVEVTRRGRTHRGILMPHHDFSDDAIVTVKLSSGYNVGLCLEGESKVRVVSKKLTKDPIRRSLPTDESKKDVAFIGTGGTIASYVDYRTGAVHPAKSAEELAFSVPELMDVCNVRARVLYSIYSENMEVNHWQELARAAASELNSGASGAVVPHGTDTMGFTSAALSFMLGRLSGPVVCVGSQRSSDRPSSDATMNLLAATRLCVSSDIGEVVVVMHGDISDTYCVAHRGVKVRKMHSSRRDAFRSVDIDPVARVEGSEISLLSGYSKRAAGPVEVRDKMSERVSMLYFYPGFEPEHFEMISGNVEGLIIAGTGLGHVSEKLVKPISKAVKNGVFVGVTTQCLYGAVNLNVYSTGRDMISAGAVPLGNMLPETAYVKLMWVLGQTKDPSEVAAMMVKDLAGETTSRRSV
ncbi:MAG: Glu-tRNA(Gln) amidotransferase subunit GatD [Methanobacteriota archaeon]|nr:MAG: Glu-tRNA(Gln) amidotransferase subunit GatD [Euryarchaeota archaeon]